MSETSDKNAQLSPVKRAIVELRRARGRIEALERAKSEPIAIIGAGLRFPGGANDLGKFLAFIARWDRHGDGSARRPMGHRGLL